MDGGTAISILLPVEDSSVKTPNDLLSYVKVNGLQMSASDFIKLDEGISAFHQWADHADNQSTVEDDQHDQDDKDDDEMTQEEPPSLANALEMIRRLHLLASIRQPELHRLVADLG